MSLPPLSPLSFSRLFSGIREEVHRTASCRRYYRSFIFYSGFRQMCQSLHPSSTPAWIASKRINCLHLGALGGEMLPYHSFLSPSRMRLIESIFPGARVNPPYLIVSKASVTSMTPV